MPSPTYTLISEQVLGSASNAVTFSSIPGTYKDLVIEVMATGFSSGGNIIAIQFNGDTTTNYSGTGVIGTGTAAQSNRYSNLNAAPLGGYNNGTGTGVATVVGNVQSYTSTSVNKTVLSRFASAGTQTDAGVGLWRKTPEAITSLTVYMYGGVTTISVGSTFRLWGVVG